MNVEILILFYSRHGSVMQMAREIAYGVQQYARTLPDIETTVSAKLRTVPPVSAVCEQTAPTVPEEGLPYATLDDLASCDGLILGSPTRFGNGASPIHYFLEQSTALWHSGALEGKPAAVFTAASTLHGGQETTLWSMMPALLHHGMLLVGLPYSEPSLSHTESGGTPYGASHWSGTQHERMLTSHEQHLCRALGQRVAKIAHQLKKPS